MSTLRDGTATRPSYYDDLTLSLSEAWGLLGRGVKDRRSPFHTPVLATAARNGAPGIRTVVLRGASREAGQLRFHSDRRSQKIVQLRDEPRCAVLAYDPDRKLQLRLEGRASIHVEDIAADEAWARSQQQSRACYTQNLAPGAVVDAPLISPPLPSADQEAGRANFCVILINIVRIEWLYLHHSGHRRAAWDRTDAGGWDGAWLAP